MQTRNIAHTRLALALSLTLAGAVAWAADADTADHTAHHPAGAASAPKSVRAPVQKPVAKPNPAKTADNAAAEKMGMMDGQMKAMHEMHQKFVEAKTPEERSALMPEHMKTMQEAMASMEGMRGTGMMGGTDKGQMMDKVPSDMMRDQVMEKRMDMMQSMMQMMMDRISPPTTK